MLHVKVQFLDDSHKTFVVDQKALGKELFNMSCSHLNLTEKEYFGLEFKNNTGYHVWLALLKPITKQVRNPKETIFKFMVKFFPVDPGQLRGELTRYLFALQVKKDLASGKLPCNDNSGALMTSYILQAELGDYEEETAKKHLELNQYLPNQEYLDNKILKYYQRHVGKSPAEADMQLLDIARKLDMFGIRSHQAIDGENLQINLAVAHMGVLVLRGNTKINTFNWATIRKLSFKRKNFLIKLHPHIDTLCKDTLEFTMVTRDACKAFWKTCVEYHAFFRLSEEPKCKPKPFLCSKGSNFRYSGRTQKQLFDSWTKGKAKNMPFERKHLQANLHERQCRSSPDLLTELAKQPTDLRLVYTSRPCSRSVNSVGWDPFEDRKRRNSAVDVLFSSRTERFKPEEIVSDVLQPSKSSSSFPGYSYSNLSHEAIHQRSQRRPMSCYEETNHFTDNRKSSSEGCMREVLPSLSRTSDTSPEPSSSRHHLRKESPNRYCYTDGLMPFPAEASAVVEEIIKLTSQSKLFPGKSADRSPSARRLTEYHQPVYPRTSCKGSAGIVSRPDTQITNMESSQEPYPKRSLSHSDMKSAWFPRSSEFRPLGPYPFLSRTSNVSRSPLPHKLIPLPLPPPPLPPPPPPPSLLVQSSTSQKGPHVIERYVYSGTESSDSESEIINPYYYAVFGKNVRHPMARVRLSSGSLQLDEEEDTCAWESRKPKSKIKHYHT
ncbi:FERM domain-containing protein 7 [Gastrophryne carolinensis]